MTSRATLARLREVLARELETISLYERMAEEEADPEMKVLFQHLADEEKEHVTETYEALLRRDAKQAEWSSGAHVEAIRSGTLAAAVDGPSRVAPAAHAATAATASPAPAAAASASPAAPKAAARLLGPATVGSLFGVGQD